MQLEPTDQLLAVTFVDGVIGLNVVSLQKNIAYITIFVVSLQKNIE